MSNMQVSALVAELNLRPGCTPAHVEREISVRINSVIYLARLDEGPAGKAAVKCCRVSGTDRIDPVAATQQFEALRRVHAASSSQSARFTVPEPLWSSPRLGAFAMSWIEGASLTDMLARKGALAELLTAVEQTGQWLGRFHLAGPLHTVSDSSQIANKAEYVLTMQAAPVRHPQFMRNLQVLAHLGTAVAKLPLRVSWLHGDCKSDNFLLTGEGVCGIDIQLGHENAIEHDLAQFLNHFELLTTRLKFRHRRAAGPALRQAFLQGYRSTGLAPNEILLHWIQLWGASTFWHARVAVAAPAWPQRWLLNRMFANQAKGLVSGYWPTGLETAST